MDPSFSTRVPSRLDFNELTLLRERLSRSGVSIVDLTESNPTQVGLMYPPDLRFQLGPLTGPRRGMFVRGAEGCG